MLIEDGTGSGRTARVNDENRLQTSTITSSLEHAINHEKGLAFNVLFQQTPTYLDPSTTDSGDVCIFYMKNTSETTIVLEGIDLRLAGTSQTTIIKVIGKDSGTPVGGTTITPANLNLGSGKTADGTFLGGDQITGLSGGTELLKVYIESSNVTLSYNFEQDIIVPKNNIITIYSSEVDTEVDAMIIFNYHSETAG